MVYLPFIFIDLIGRLSEVWPDDAKLVAMYAQNLPIDE